MSAACMNDISDYYTVRITGDELTPRYRAGEILVVTPGREPAPGCDVFVVMKDGSRSVKVLGDDLGNAVQLCNAVNPHLATVVARNEIVSIHRIASRYTPQENSDRGHGGPDGERA